MQRIILIGLAVMLTACANTRVSHSLQIDAQDSDRITWQAIKPEGDCSANRIVDFEFILEPSGVWKSNIKMLNWDRDYRPYWDNTLSLHIELASGEIHAFDVLTDTLKARTKRSFSPSGSWSFGKEYFAELKAAKVMLIHNCHGLQESDLNVATHSL